MLFVFQCLSSTLLLAFRISNVIAYQFNYFCVSVSLQLERVIC